MPAMSLNAAIETLMEFYSVEVEDGAAVAVATTPPDKIPGDVWNAWARLASRIPSEKGTPHED